jgi:hypothetical protein
MDSVHIGPRERRAKQHQQEIIDLVNDLGIYRCEQILNVHRTTLQRWMRGQSKVPEAALFALRGVAKGQLPGQDDSSWQGWHFHNDGNLYSPDGRPFHVGDLLAQQYERQLLKAQQARIKELEAKLARLEEFADRIDIAANERRA